MIYAKNCRKRQSKESFSTRKNWGHKGYPGPPRCLTSSPSPPHTKHRFQDEFWHSFRPAASTTGKAYNKNKEYVTFRLWITLYTVGYVIISRWSFYCIMASKAETSIQKQTLKIDLNNKCAISSLQTSPVRRLWFENISKYMVLLDKDNHSLLHFGLPIFERDGWLSR
jgi:hypothetical protein